MDQESKLVSLRVPDSMIRAGKRSKRLEASAPAKKRRRLKPIYRRRFIIRLSIVSLFPLIIIGFAVWAFTYKNAIEVYASDELIGLVRMDKQLSVESLLKEAEDKLCNDYQAQVIVTPDISLKPVRAAKGSISEKNELLNKLCGKLPFKVQACAFILEGKPLAVLKDKSEALAVQDNIFDKYHSRNTESSSFVENVSIEDIFIEKSAIISMGKAFDTLTAESALSTVYVVQKGDMLGLIAERNKMTLDGLIAANPGITAKSTLKEGQMLNIETTAPLLSVKTIETAVSDETAPAPVQHQINPRAQTTRILQEGRDGIQRVTKRVTRINGIIQEEEIIGFVIKEEPVPQIVEMPQE